MVRSTELGLVGIHGAGGVVAIRAVQHVALRNQVEARVGGRGVQVAEAVAVVVRPVVELQGLRIGVVHEPVAVVIEVLAIADLEHVRIDRRQGVVAVVRVGRGARGLFAAEGSRGPLLAVAIAVGVHVERARIREVGVVEIDERVAILVDAGVVADFHGARVDAGVVVVAVAVVRDRPSGLRAVLDRQIDVAVPVEIEVRVEGAVDPLVGLVVAVVVDAVAGFLGARVHAGIEVVAVAIGFRDTVEVHVGGAARRWRHRSGIIVFVAWFALFSAAGRKHDERRKGKKASNHPILRRGGHRGGRKLPARSGEWRSVFRTRNWRRTTSVRRE